MIWLNLLCADYVLALNDMVVPSLCGLRPSIERHGCTFEVTDLAALAHLEVTVAQCSKYTKKHSKSELFVYFFCIFAFFVVPLHAILRVYAR